VPADGPTVTDERLIAAARPHFAGRIVAGRVLMAL
jgi:hypothetical protein